MRLEIRTGAPPPKPPALEVDLPQDIRRWLKLFAAHGLHGHSEAEVVTSLVRQSIDHMLAAGMIAIDEPSGP